MRQLHGVTVTHASIAWCDYCTCGTLAMFFVCFLSLVLHLVRVSLSTSSLLLLLVSWGLLRAAQQTAVAYCRRSVSGSPSLAAATTRLVTFVSHDLLGRWLFSLHKGLITFLHFQPDFQNDLTAQVKLPQVICSS